MSLTLKIGSALRDTESVTVSLTSLSLVSNLMISKTVMPEKLLIYILYCKKWFNDIAMDAEDVALLLTL